MYVFNGQMENKGLTFLSRSLISRQTDIFKVTRVRITLIFDPRNMFYPSELVSALLELQCLVQSWTEPPVLSYHLQFPMKISVGHEQCARQTPLAQEKYIRQSLITPSVHDKPQLITQASVDHTNLS